MLLMPAGSLRAARFAAMPFMALMSSACGNQQDSTAPTGARPVEVSAQSISGGNATAAIEEIVNDVTAAWAAKNATAYAAHYAEDMQAVSPTGILQAGREAFRAQHVFLYNGPFAGSTQTIEVRDIRFLTGTIAIVQQDVSLTGYAFLPPGLPSSGGVVRSRVTWVVEKRGGSWEIVFQQMTPRL